MIERVKNYIKKYHMLSDGDTVTAGISGGADSVCLLFVLKELQQEMNLTILAVHVNHKIRPEAGEDAAYVERLCSRLDVPFFLIEENVEELAKEQGISTEEAGREVRYQAFCRVLEEQASRALAAGKGKIAVAHNRNDRAETMLFHLFRGTGISGLGSIRPVRENIIRPLLCVSREEIERYLNERGISYCIDKTNNEDTYTRNKIRHHILPYAQQQISGNVLEHMSNTADLMLETEDFIRQAVANALEACAKNENGQIRIGVPELRKQHTLIQKQLILAVIAQLSSTKKDISAVHVRDVLRLFEEAGNRQVMLPYGILARREYEEVVFACPVREEEKNVLCELEINPQRGGTILVPRLGELDFYTFSYEKNMDIPQNQYTKWFDCDKIDEPLKIRTRRTGDYLTINKRLSTKSIQDYMVDEKIPKEQRGQVWLVAEGSHVLWVLGHRISEKYKVSENTKTILQIQLRGGHGDGRAYQGYAE